MRESMGVMSPTTEADIAAFRFDHPLDSVQERIKAHVGPGEYILEQRHVFEIFAFSAEEIGEVIFDVRGIKEALAASKVKFQMFDTPMNERWVEHIREKGGVEVERMASLTAADLERPAIAIYWPNGYTTVIDGNNRLVRRWDDGLRDVRMAVIPLDQKVMGAYLCRPGEEEQFLRRRQAEDPRADELTSLGFRRVGIV